MTWTLGIGSEQVDPVCLVRSVHALPPDLTIRITGTTKQN